VVVAAFLFQIVPEVTATDPKDRLYNIMGMLAKIKSPEILNEILLIYRSENKIDSV